MENDYDVAAGQTSADAFGREQRVETFIQQVCTNYGWTFNSLKKPVRYDETELELVIYPDDDSISLESLRAMSQFGDVKIMADATRRDHVMIYIKVSRPISIPRS